MASEIKGSVGDEAEQAAIGSHNRQSNRRNDDSHRSGSSITFQGDYGDAAIWREIVGLGKDISAVNIRLDDLPDRVKVLEVRFMAGPPPAVSTLSLTALYWITGFGFFLIIAMIAIQVILQAVR